MDSKIEVDGFVVNCQYRVKQAFLDCDSLIVLFSPDVKPDNDKQFHNLICINKNGDTIWEAELPTTMSNDLYYKISSFSPLIAYSRCSYSCVIEKANGSIISKEFYK